MRSDITAQIWTQAAQHIAHVLGAENIRAVGGCVRDALLGRTFTDIDFATTHTPEIVMDLLQKAGVPSKPTGLAHGTVTAFYQGHNFEITTLREDVETTGRRAVVKYTKDWGIDAQRRDFTINAFYLDDKGILFDGSLQGEADLANRTLRFIGNAETRIKEDYLRILRLFRFAAQLGFALDAAAIGACANEKEGLTLLSGERVTSEWDKMLVAPYAARSLELMMESGLQSVYPFHNEAAKRMARLKDYTATHLALSYIVCFEGDMPPIFMFSRKREKYIQTLLSLRDNPMSWQECAYRHGHDMAADLYLWRCVTQNKPIDDSILDEIGGYIPPVCPINPETFMKEGYQGAELGEKLYEARENWITKAFAQI